MIHANADAPSAVAYRLDDSVRLGEGRDDAHSSIGSLAPHR
jgi:hypothetical protein